MPKPIRIAMWSGPRNISTAMMRSWGNRSDTAVVDEPLYAHYLAETGLDHPGAAEVIEHHESDWRLVVEDLTGDIPGGKAVYYQKQMAHHLLPGIDRTWLGAVTNGFLIRDPREMLTSLIKNIPAPTLEDTGLPQQVEIFDQTARASGAVPPVLDSRQVLEDPRRQLGALCEAVGVAFDEAMLSWPPGRRPTDGIWAHHWYHAVEKSTGFQPYRPKDEELPRDLEPLYGQCLEHYQYLHEHRLGV